MTGFYCSHEVESHVSACYFPTLSWISWANFASQASAIFCVLTYQKFPAVVSLCLVFLLEFSLTAIAFSGARADPAYLFPSPTSRVAA